MRGALDLVAHAHHGLAGGVDGGRILCVQEEHGAGRAGVERLAAHAAQRAHVHGHVAEVDVHRTGRVALVADRAVVGHVLELFPMLQADAATGLLFVQEGLDQQRSRQDLVARRVQQVRARHVGRTDRLALAAAQAVLDGFGDGADIALLHDERFVSHQAEAGRPGVAQVRAGHQLAGVEVAVGVDAALVFLERGQLGLGREFVLVRPMPCSPEITPSRSRAICMMRSTAAWASRSMP